MRQGFEDMFRKNYYPIELRIILHHLAAPRMVGLMAWTGSAAEIAASWVNILFAHDLIHDPQLWKQLKRRRTRLVVLETFRQRWCAGG